MAFQNIHCKWILGLLIAFVMQLGLQVTGLNFLSGFLLLLLMTFVYNARPVYLWGDLDPCNESALAESNQDLPLVTPPATCLDDEQERENVDTESVAAAASTFYTFASPDEEVATVDHSLPVPQRRFYFLDNIKIFLTALVLAHHVACGFGGCGEGWMLVVGENNNTCTLGLTMFTSFNQSFFMPLFFFISAYFTPRSFEKKGALVFVQDKARRLLVPAWLVTIVLMPLSFVPGSMVGGAPFVYFPAPGQTWFLLWLLVFNWAYVTLVGQVPPSAEASIDTASNSKRPFPGWATRWFVWGLLICGIATLVTLITGLKEFWAMPMAHGSLICDILFFAAGTSAYSNGWLKRSGVLPTGPSAWFLRVCVILETCVLSVLLYLMNEGGSGTGLYRLAFVLVAGVLCVDASLAFVQFFELRFNVLPYHFLARSAYAVYVIHPPIVTACTAVFVFVYNQLYDDIIQFDSNSPTDLSISRTYLNGPDNGSLHLFIGFASVLAVSNLICWPLAWLLVTRTRLKNYL